MQKLTNFPLVIISADIKNQTLVPAVSPIPVVLGKCSNLYIFDLNFLASTGSQDPSLGLCQTVLFSQSLLDLNATCGIPQGLVLESLLFII